MILIAMLLASGQMATTTPPTNPYPNRGMHQGMRPRDGAFRQQRFDRMFQMADTNHDGQLSKAELENWRMHQGERREHRQERMGMRQNGQGGWNGQQGAAPQR